MIFMFFTNLKWTWIQKTVLEIQILFTDLLALAKLFNTSEPQFLHLRNGGKILKERPD